MITQTNQNGITPTKKESRIQFLDVLRGIAILFIFIANIVYFSGYVFFPEEGLNPKATFFFDKQLDFIMHTLIDGKFYSIFSLLFGIGCVIQYTNLEKHGKPFGPFFRRRMLWLLVIGLIHLCLIWLGDILTLYAILGFILVWFVKLSDRKLLQFATVLILLPILNWLVLHFANLNLGRLGAKICGQYMMNNEFPFNEYNGIAYPDFVGFISNPNLADFFMMNIGNTAMRIGGILSEGRIFKVFGIFLIGIWTGRQILHSNLLENKKFLKKVAWWGVIVGLPISIFRTYLEYFAPSGDFWGLASTVAYAFGTVPLALGYAAFLALAYLKKQRFLNVFAPVGKTALSNYIFQTFIAISIFYGVGFGLGGKLGYTLILIITISIFILQMVMSKWWLSHFRFGPLEWVWRQLTYGKKLKIKKD